METSLEADGNMTRTCVGLPDKLKLVAASDFDRKLGRCSKRRKSVLLYTKRFSLDVLIAEPSHMQWESTLRKKKLRSEYKVSSSTTSVATEGAAHQTAKSSSAPPNSHICSGNMQIRLIIIYPRILLRSICTVRFSRKQPPDTLTTLFRPRLS